MVPRIDDLKPGRELDALVAEKVMEWTTIIFNGGAIGGCAPESTKAVSIPAYSTDIAAAWEVVEKLAKPLKVVWTGKVWVCEVFGEPYSQEADTAPLAICLAALDYVTPLGEVDKEFGGVTSPRRSKKVQTEEERTQ